MKTKKHFKILVKILRPLIRFYLLKHFGPRCPDFEIDCECCRRWRLAEKLLRNPYA